MKLMPSKNDSDSDAQKRKLSRESSIRLFKHMLLRCIISALLLDIASIYMISNYSGRTSQSFVWETSDIPLTSDSVVATQATTMFLFLWLCVWNGFTFMYRNLSLFKQFPRNRTYMKLRHLRHDFAANLWRTNLSKFLTV